MKTPFRLSVAWAALLKVVVFQGMVTAMGEKLVRPVRGACRLG